MCVAAAALEGESGSLTNHGVGGFDLCLWASCTGWAGQRLLGSHDANSSRVCVCKWMKGKIAECFDS